MRHHHGADITHVASDQDAHATLLWWLRGSTKGEKFRMQTKPVAVVTGAGSGVGQAIARALGQSGRRLVLVGRDGAKLRRTAEAVESESECLALDLAEEDSAGAIAAAAGPSVEVLVHAAAAYE